MNSNENFLNPAAMPQSIVNYFYFSRAERIGAVVLILISIVAFVLPELVGWLRPRPVADFSAFKAKATAYRQAVEHGDSERSTNGDIPALAFSFDPNTASMEDFVALGLSQKVARTICNYRNKGGKFSKPEDLQKVYGLNREDYTRLLPYIQVQGRKEREEEKAIPKAEEFAFDPNTASEAELKRLGLPPRLVSNLLKYRDKGGKFRKAEDLLKLYGFPEEDFSRLAPFVTVGAKELPPSTAEGPRPTTHSRGSDFGGRSSALDINRAGPEEWAKLPGIGAGRTRQIIQYRTKLGGFTSLEQVGETWGLPDSVFQLIRPLLQVSTPVIRQINLNTATAEELNAHPYFSFKQAQLILNYRTQHGHFASVNDLTKIIPFKDPMWLEKVKPYLRVE